MGKELDILVGVKLIMSQQGILILKKANHALELLKVSVVSAFRGSDSLLGADKDTQGLLLSSGGSFAQY